MIITSYPKTWLSGCTIGVPRRMSGIGLIPTETRVAVEVVAVAETPERGLVTESTPCSSTRLYR